MAIQLPHVNDLQYLRLTVKEQAERLYPGITFDYALPQPWVDECRTMGFDVRGHAVWLYPAGAGAFGEPGALTQEFFTWYCLTFKRLPFLPAEKELSI